MPQPGADQGPGGAGRRRGQDEDQHEDRGGGEVAGLGKRREGQDQGLRVEQRDHQHLAPAGRRRARSGAAVPELPGEEREIALMSALVGPGTARRAATETAKGRSALMSGRPGWRRDSRARSPLAPVSSSLPHALLRPRARREDPSDDPEEVRVRSRARPYPAQCARRAATAPAARRARPPRSRRRCSSAAGASRAGCGRHTRR